MHSNAQRLRDLIDYKERQAADAESKEKQALIAAHQHQTDLKMAKDEIKRLSSMVLHRESRFNHEAKRRDQEIARVLDALQTLERRSRSRSSVKIRAPLSLPLPDYFGSAAPAPAPTVKERRSFTAP